MQLLLVTGNIMAVEVVKSLKYHMLRGQLNTMSDNYNSNNFKLNVFIIFVLFIVIIRQFCIL